MIEKAFTKASDQKLDVCFLAQDIRKMKICHLFDTEKMFGLASL